MSLRKYLQFSFVGHPNDTIAIEKLFQGCLCYSRLLLKIMASPILFRELDCQFLDDEFGRYILFAFVISSWEKPGGSEVQSRHLSQQDNRHFSRTNCLFALPGGTPRRQSGKQLCTRIPQWLIDWVASQIESHHFMAATSVDKKATFLLCSYFFSLCFCQICGIDMAYTTRPNM